MVRRLIKYLFVLALLGAAAIAGYAMFFDLPVEKEAITISVTPLTQ